MRLHCRAAAVNDASRVNHTTSAIVIRAPPRARVCGGPISALYNVYVKHLSHARMRICTRTRHERDRAFICLFFGET